MSKRYDVLKEIRDEIYGLQLEVKRIDGRLDEFQDDLTDTCEIESENIYLLSRVALLESFIYDLGLDPDQNYSLHDMTAVATAIADVLGVRA